MLQGVIFDLDGTLVDNHDLIYAAYIEVFSKFTGHAFTPADIRAMFGPDERGILQRVVPERWEEGLAAFYAYYQQAEAKQGQLFPGIEGLLVALQARKLMLGLVTGRSEQGALLTLQGRGIHPYFPMVSGGWPAGSRKATCLQEVVTAWRLPPAEVAYVGDSPFDMQDALTARVQPLGAAWLAEADAAALRAAGAREVFQSPQALQHWLCTELDEPASP